MRRNTNILSTQGVKERVGPAVLVGATVGRTGLSQCGTKFDPVVIQEVEGMSAPAIQAPVAEDTPLYCEASFAEGIPDIRRNGGGTMAHRSASVQIALT